MSNSVKAAVVTGVFALAVGIIGTIGVNSITNNNQVVSVYVNGAEVQVSPGEYQAMYDELKSKYDALEFERDSLNDEKAASEEENNITAVPVVTESPTPPQTTAPSEREICFNELPVYNCQYSFGSSWDSYSLPSWDNYNNNAADGNAYENIAYFGLSGRAVNVEYLLDKKYTFLSCKYMLDESTRSTTDIVIMKIYDENDNLLYESPEITGGMLPQEIISLDVSDVTKLRIEFKTEEGPLGDRRSYFGVVWIDPVLKVK